MSLRRYRINSVSTPSELRPGRLGREEEKISFAEVVIIYKKISIFVNLLECETRGEEIAHGVDIKHFNVITEVETKQ